MVCYHFYSQAKLAISKLSKNTCVPYIEKAFQVFYFTIFLSYPFHSALLKVRVINWAKSLLSCWLPLKYYSNSHPTYFKLSLASSKTHPVVSILFVSVYAISTVRVGVPPFYCHFRWPLPKISRVGLNLARYLLFSILNCFANYRWVYSYLQFRT